MKKQIWFCDSCRKTNCLEVDPLIQEWEMVTAIRNDHHLLSPTCEQTVLLLRVVFAEEIRNRRELQRADIPFWVREEIASFLHLEKEE